MADNKDNVIYLAFDNPAVAVESTVDILACRGCRNKTFKIIVVENAGGEVECAACGASIGPMGWMPPDDGGPA